jgi:predicted Ser/Thr protein kinase
MSEAHLETRWCAKCGGEMSAEDTGPICAGCALAGAFESPDSGGESVPLNLADIPVPGEKLQYIGDYELLSVIAQGGMGVVYKARQRTLNREVALKLLLGGAHATAEFKKRFLQEAETAGKLQHSNIVPIYEVGEHEGQPFFSMEYVAGSDLAKLTREQPLETKRAAECVKTVAEAIEYAHQQGILHRDLKPSNILIGRDGRLRITDFGLARETKTDSSLTLTGTTLGTPGFMPPEQVSVKRGQVGPVSDVYSLGAVLYCLVTGRPPFAAGTLADILQQVVTAEPVSPRQLNPAVPRDVETICLKCLEKEPRRRYASAQALADDLGRFVRGEPISARPVGAAERVVKWYRREPVVAGLVTAVVCVLALGVAGTSWGWRTAQNSGDAAKRAAQATEEERQKVVRLNTSLAAEKDAADKARADAVDKQHKAEELERQLSATNTVFFAERAKSEEFAKMAQAKFAEAARTLASARKENTNAAVTAAGATNVIENQAYLLAQQQTREAEMALQEAQQARTRAMAAEKAMAAQLASAQPGSADYTNIATEASAAIQLAERAREDLTTATQAYQAATQAQTAATPTTGPPTLTVAATGCGVIPSWQPAMGASLAEMITTSLGKLTNFSVMDSAAVSHGKQAEYTLRTTITRYNVKKGGFGGSTPLGGLFRGAERFVGGAGASIDTTTTEIQIDWQIFDNTTGQLAPGATGAAPDSDTGVGFNVGTGNGLAFSSGNQQFMDSALGKATLKAVNKVIAQIRGVSLPRSAGAMGKDVAATAQFQALRNVKGQVIGVDKSGVWVNLGSKNAFGKGDHIRIYRAVENKNASGEKIATTYEAIGDIILTAVQPDRSMGQASSSVAFTEGLPAAEITVDINQFQ